MRTAPASMVPLLEIDELRVAYTSRTAAICPALAGVSLQVAPGEVLGILGESGSGKSTLAASILRLLPPNGRIRGGRVSFEGTNVGDLSQEELRKIRGARIGLINQEPSSALHPTVRIDRQVGNVLAAHGSLDRRKLRAKVSEVLNSVFASEAERIARAFPHELSGGQRQRVLIAQAIACGPSLLIADEPTASLDPTTQQEILLLFRTLKDKLGLSIIFITHNPALLADFADRIMVLYAGRIAEIGLTTQLLSSPSHPYTVALLRSMPSEMRASETVPKPKLPAIPGEPPDLSFASKGCPFEPRCNVRMPICKRDDPPAFNLGNARSVACFKFAPQADSLHES